MRLGVHDRELIWGGGATADEATLPHSSWHRRPQRVAILGAAGLGLVGAAWIADYAAGRQTGAQPHAGLAAIVFAVLFVAPFVDLRRLRRLLHLDLLVLVAFAIPHALYRTRATEWAAVPTILLLGYLLVRVLKLGFRPRERDSALVPHIPISWLAVALVIVVVVRVGMNVLQPDVVDVGYASVVGADRVSKGQTLYAGDFPRLCNDGRCVEDGDTYGPATYLAYVPFEQLFGWSGDWDAVPAAHAAAITFDLLTLLGLLILGRRIRRGSAGTALGIALAFMWAAYPYTLFGFALSSNDGLIGAILVWSLVAISSPGTSGVLIGFGAAAKAIPAAVAPVFAAGTGERRRASFVLFALGFGIVTLAVVAPLLPDGGVRELYDRTVGYQGARGTDFTIWHRYSALAVFQPVAVAAASLLAVALAFVPRRRTTVQVASLAAAAIIAVELAHSYWFVYYVAWFAPLVFVAIAGDQARVLRLKRVSSPPGVRCR